MSDQLPWCKIWGTCLTDTDLEELTIHEWFCWVRLQVYIKLHGGAGKLRFRHPSAVMENLLRVKRKDVVSMLNRLKNVAVSSETIDGVSYVEVEFKNWHKYQDDLSTRRVRKFREKLKRLDETDKRRVEKKRKDVDVKDVNFNGKEEENGSGSLRSAEAATLAPHIKNCVCEKCWRKNHG